MSSPRAYLDYNASAPMRPQVVASMNEVFAQPGNASSVHGEGRHYRKLIELARNQLADLVHGESDGVTFTSSATEAAHLALTPDIHSDGQLRAADRLYVLATEHPCVLAGGRFETDQIVTVPVKANGLVDLEALNALVNQNGEHIPYLAIQLANSETGIIQPVAEASTMIRLKGGYTLCDAVQAVGRIDVDISDLGVDFLILSAHKIGGPQGIGALISAHQVLTLPAVIRGGGQESNRRAGTENTAAIAGFGVAAELASQQLENISEIKLLRDSIEASLLPICAGNGLNDRLTIFGADVDRVCNTCLFGVEGLRAETALIAFDLDGVAVSSGSACSSGKVGGSHVLKAMQVDDTVARGAIRVSLGWNSTRNDVEKFEKSFARITKRLSEMTSVAQKSGMAGAA
ncbi:MAG: cysteine desulfurase family protein [Rhizobiaceae bacterium]